MRGTYSFFQEGKLVATSENLITELGRQHIMRYLAGLVGTLGGSLAVGIGAVAPTSTDDRLTLEFDRATVSLSSVDFINNRIVFKGTLEQGLVGTIYESGLFSQALSTDARGYESRLLFAFGNSDGEAWTGNTYAAGNNRLAANAMRVTAPTSGSGTATLSNIIMDLSGYSASDIFKIAYAPTNAFTSNIKIRFLDADPTSYYETTITPIGTGYQISTFNRNNLTKVGTTADLSNIAGVSVIVTSTAGGSAIVDFDAMRVEDMDTLDKTNILVSRTVLATPVVKNNIVPMEIEYALDVSVT
jgi:hypothetical protein